MKWIAILALAAVGCGCGEQPAMPQASVLSTGATKNALSGIQLDVDNHSRWEVSVLPALASTAGENVMLGPPKEKRGDLHGALSQASWTPFRNLGDEPKQVVIQLVADKSGSGRMGERTLVFELPAHRFDEAQGATTISVNVDDNGATCKAFGMTAHTPWTVWQNWH